MQRLMIQQHNDLSLDLPQEIHTVVHVDSHAYVDAFLDKGDAQDHISNFEPVQGMWKIISKVVG